MATSRPFTAGVKIMNKIMGKLILTPRDDSQIFNYDRHVDDNSPLDHCQPKLLRASVLPNSTMPTNISLNQGRFNTPFDFSSSRHMPLYPANTWQGDEEDDHFSFNQDYKTEKEYRKNLAEIDIEKKLEMMRQNLSRRFVSALGYDIPVYNILANNLPKDLYEVVNRFASVRGLDFGSVLLAVLGAYTCSLCGAYGVQIESDSEPDPVLLNLYFAVSADIPIINPAIKYISYAA